MRSCFDWFWPAFINFLEIIVLIILKKEANGVRNKMKRDVG